MNKTKSFVKQIVALLKGDDAEQTAQKVMRQADSAFKTQIATLTGDTIGLEDAVENANEKLALSKVNNGVLIADRNQYIRNILEAKNNLTICEDNLKLHLEKIDFLETQHASLNDE